MPTCSRCSTSATCCCTTPTSPTIRSSRCVDAGRRRSGRARDQADALPHERRLADHRQPAARRRAQQAGDGARRADGALRRGAQHPAGRARSRRRARTSSTASAATRRTRRSAWSSGATPHGLRRYVHLGTGNYNERTARIYTDFGLHDRRRRRSPRTRRAFFSALTGYSDPPRLKKLVMAPTDLRGASCS